MVTLDKQKAEVGNIVKCIETCKDENDTNSFIKGQYYYISYWYGDSDSTFGLKDCRYIVKKKYFTLINPDEIINTYEIY